jgi:hypothetical protein
LAETDTGKRRRLMALGTIDFRDRRLGRLLLGFLLLLPWTVACGDDEVASGLQDLSVAVAEPRIEIGAVDDSDFAFTFVGGIEVAPDGTVLSLHPQEASIRRWTEDGQPAGTIGRRGEGPGEFSRPQSMGWVGDTLWVLDLANYRFSFYSPDGSFLRSVSPPVDLGSAELAREGIYPPRPHRLLADGTIWSRTPAFSQQVMEGTLTRVLHARTDREGSLLDTLVVQPVSPRGSLGLPLPGGGGVFTRQPFGDEVLLEGLPDGSGLLMLERPAATDLGAAEFTLTRVGLGGDTVFSRAYPYAPIPIPRERVDSVIEAQADQFNEWLGEQRNVAIGEWRRLVRDALYVPPHYPPVGIMVAGRDGSIWLSPEAPDPDAEQLGREWIVLDPEGEPLYRVRIPARSRVLLAERDGFWGVVLDDLDVEYITRFRVWEQDGGEADP